MNWRSERQFRKLVHSVESTLQEWGLAPKECVADHGNDSLRWDYSYHGIEISVCAVASDARFPLYLHALLLPLPDDGILPLYRRMLEANSNEIVGAALGVNRAQVLLTAERAVAEVSRIWVQTELDRFNDLAGHCYEALSSFIEETQDLRAAG